MHQGKCLPVQVVSQWQCGKEKKKNEAKEHRKTSLCVDKPGHCCNMSLLRRQNAQNSLAKVRRGDFSAGPDDDC